MTNVKDSEIIFKALGNKRRLTMIRFIRTANEVCVGDIAEEVNLSFKSTSRHLAVLERADILEKEQRGLQVFFRISKSMPTLTRKVLGFI